MEEQVEEKVEQKNETLGWELNGDYYEKTVPICNQNGEVTSEELLKIHKDEAPWMKK